VRCLSYSWFYEWQLVHVFRNGSSLLVNIFELESRKCMTPEGIFKSHIASLSIALVMGKDLVM